MTGTTTTSNTMVSTQWTTLRLSMCILLLLHHMQMLLPGAQQHNRFSLLCCQLLPSRHHQHRQQLPNIQLHRALLLSSILGMSPVHLVMEMSSKAANLCAYREWSLCWGRTATKFSFACRPKAKAAAAPGYMSMPDGSFKVVPKEGRPAYIAPNVPKKRAGTAAADARPAFIQVCTAP